MSQHRSRYRSREDCIKRRVTSTDVFVHSLVVTGNFSKFANDLIALIPDRDAVDQVIAAHEQRWERSVRALEALGCLAVQDIADHERRCKSEAEDFPVPTLRACLFGEVDVPASPPPENQITSAEERGTPRSDSEVTP